MLDPWLVVVGVLALGLTAVARRLDRWPVSVPLLALLVGVAAGPHGAGVLAVPSVDHLPLLETSSRLLLAVALMAVALRAPLAELRPLVGPVTWLLLVVLPGMAIMGGLAAAVTLGLTLPMALALGAALAPTDPVLASSVVSGDEARRVLPSTLRSLLALESGANDGLALGLVVLAAAMVQNEGPGGALLTTLWEIGGGVLVGVGLGWLAGRALRRAEERRDVDRSRALTFTLVLSLTALGVGTLLQTDGLLAVFVTGLAFNRQVSAADRQEEHRFDEALNRFLVLPFFVLLGLLLPLEGWRDLGAAGLAFVALLLVLRRLPLLLLVRPVLGVSGPGAVWLGWFGPMGVAAVYYLAHLDQLGLIDPVLWHAGSLAVVGSVVVHGVTAAPAVPLYARVADRSSSRV